MVRLAEFTDTNVSNVLNISAKSIIDEINKCPNLQFLNLEGNTLGVEASKGIAKALEKHPEFKRALWKDMFTGRMKTEIPKSLVNLSNISCSKI